VHVPRIWRGISPPKLDATAGALAEVRRRFPFPGYIEGMPDAYDELAETVTAHVPAGGRVLDFGAGPADKTALLQQLGYQCVAYDDLDDEWHRVGDNRARILEFAREVGIDYRLAKDGLPEGPFDAVLVLDVLEHLHDSPRRLLNDLVGRLRDGGHLIVTVPNAANARKRASLVLGRTNMPDFTSFYWLGDPYRGHVREYVRDDLVRLARFLGLEPVVLRGTHHLAGRLPLPVRVAFKTVALFANGLADTWLFVARKPLGWTPTELAEHKRVELLDSLTPYRYETGPG
jgi:SAM-dependent methyltransferase